jgi:hypothetical protein
LNRYWQQLQNPVSAPAPVKAPAPKSEPKAAALPPTPPPPAKSSPAPKPETKAKPLTSLDLVDTPEESDGISLSVADGLEGLNLNLQPENEPLIMPEGLNFDLGPASKPSQGPQLEGLNVPEDSALAIDPSTSSGTSSMVIMGGMEAAPPPPEKNKPHRLDAIPDGPPEIPTETPVPGDNKQFKAFMEDSVIMQVPASGTFTGSLAGAPRAASPADSMIDIKKTAPEDISTATTENEAVAWAFKKMKDHFTQSMILLFEGDRVKPWKWEKLWAPREDAAFQGLSLGSPGIFRIVHRTRLPYHGHVVPSDANREFFLNWGLPNLPAQATLVPLMMGDQPVGVLLGVGEASANNPQILMETDKIATKLADRLSRLHSSKAA